VKLLTKIPGLTLYPGIGRHWWERITPAEFRALAREIDELGFDYVSVSEHLLMDRASAPELGARWAHSQSAAGVLVGLTERITVVPLVVVPYHHPVALAKSLATLDFLSGGRVIPMCLGGYNAREFSIMNVDFEHRGAIFDEWMAAMIELWSSERPSFHGAHVSFEDIAFEPRPAQAPMTLWFGGRTKAALRRIARLGDGWMAYATPRARFRELVDYIREQPEFQARPRHLDVAIELFEGARDPVSHAVVTQARVTLDPDAVLEQLQELADLGATYCDVSDVLGLGKFQNGRPGAPPPTRSAAEQIERYRWFAAEIMPRARRIVPATAETAPDAAGHSRCT
jgi:probable F420-dependent oxidoreductase